LLPSAKAGMSDSGEPIDHAAETKLEHLTPKTMTLTAQHTGHASPISLQKHTYIMGLLANADRRSRIITATEAGLGWLNFADICDKY
jgi:hypothetical protein